MAVRTKLKKHHYYGGAAVLVAVGVAFYLGVFPMQVQGGKSPAVSNVATLSVSSTGAEVGWTTDIPTTDNICWTSYFPDKKKDRKTLQWQCTTPTGGVGNDKIARITGLTPATEYTYFVAAVDNLNQHRDVNSDFYKFTTLAQ